jgi:hypothetical protein
MIEEKYTTRLQAGLGLIQDTHTLLDLWEPELSIQDLMQKALQSGYFPNMSARRLRNVVAEGFAPRLLQNDGEAALLIKRLKISFESKEVEQLLFVYACRANLILADFVREIYWSAYRAGKESLANDDAREFVERVNQNGQTIQPWSESTIRRVAAYLTGACADFGLLESGTRKTRKILSFRIEPRVAAVLAYELHFAGHGDNRVVNHQDWQLFGLEPADVLEELKRLSRRGHFIFQQAGDVTKISWRYSSIEEVADGLS